MERVAKFIVARRKFILVAFVILTLVCSPMALLVSVNYNIIDYLPTSAQSTKALTIMDEEFSDAVPNAKVMVYDVSITEALEYKMEFAKVEGVTAVRWLDDMVDIKQPLGFSDQDTVGEFYKNGNALFDLAIAKGREQDAISALQDIVGPDNAVAGEAASLAAIQDAAVNEVVGAFLILVPAILIILALSTSSWIEPLLLLLSIAVAIVLNMGTNALFTDVSFVTNSVSPILQMAVSLDYSIFLLHSFAAYRKKYRDVNVAMTHAVASSFSTVASSATTTLFGFIALTFMQFLVGADLGINLAKGIIFSFLTAIVFLPAVTLAVYKLIDRTKHRPFSPSFENVHRVLSKLAIPVTIVVILAFVPSFLAQNRTDFLYGAESAGGDTRASSDGEKIKEEFGDTNTIVMLLPRGSVATERLLGDSLLELNYVSGVLSYAQTVGVEIPPEFLDTSITSQFYSAHYARLIIYADIPPEGELTFRTIGQIRDIAHEYYGDEAYTLGRSANLYDMKDVVQSDNLRVNLIAVLAIFLVLLITFRSVILPIILTFTIEVAIWVNLSIPYFADTQVNYIGYLVLCAVQLGATVDYAILLTNAYLRCRKTMAKRMAISKALGSSFKSILVSATTLSLAGFILLATSSNPIVCDIGLMLGRGTIMSFVMVVCFLPLMLQVFDPLIERFTWKAKFFNKVAPVYVDISGIKRGQGRNYES